MRSITRTTIRSASCAGALVLAGGSWFGTGAAFATPSGGSAGPTQGVTAPAEPTPEVRPTVEPTQEVTTESTKEPTKEATKEATAQPTKEATKEATAQPTKEATKAPETKTVTVWWLLPQGATEERASTYTQTRMPVGGKIPCGRIVQVDTYTGTQEQLDSLGDTLEPGEDSEVYQGNTWAYGDECKPSGGETTPEETPTPRPTPEPTPEVTPEPTPEVTPEPTPEVTPEPSKPVETPKPSTPVETPKPSTPVETPTPEQPLPQTPEGDEEVSIIVVVPETPAKDTPADLPLAPAPEAPAVQVHRPAALPRTGDQGTGFSPLLAGAGVCAIAFAGSFVGRRKK